MDIHFYHKAFDQLNTRELYEMLALRQQVFVVEQDCPYLDADGKDYNCLHVLGKDIKDQVIAHTRIVPPGISYEKYSSIGRVVISEAIRGSGIGKSLMLYSMQLTYEKYPLLPIKISAQVYLTKFYENLGFVVDGEAYLEDDIPHIAMIVPSKKIKY